MTFRLTFLQEIAFWLWSKKGGTSSFNSDDIPDEILQELPPGEADDIETQKREYLSGAFLEKKSIEIYYFCHRSFAEFLVAQRMLSRAPSGIEQAHYANLMRDGVALFLNEAPDRARATEWAVSLLQTQGTITVPYIKFIADSFQSIDEFLAILPKECALRKVIAAIAPPNKSDRWLVTGSTKVLLRTMREPDNETFSLAFGLFIASMSPASLRGHQWSPWAAEIAAAVLDRVFEHAIPDISISSKWYVKDVHDDARNIAVKIIPNMVSDTSGRFLILDTPALFRIQIDNKRKYGFDLSHDANALAPNAPLQSKVAWTEVKKRMGKKASGNAQKYFEYSSNLRSIYTKATITRGRPR